MMSLAKPRVSSVSPASSPSGRDWSVQSSSYSSHGRTGGGVGLGGRLRDGCESDSQLIVPLPRPSIDSSRSAAIVRASHPSPRLVASTGSAAPHSAASLSRPSTVTSSIPSAASVRSIHCKPRDSAASRSFSALPSLRHSPPPATVDRSLSALSPQPRPVSVSDRCIDRSVSPIARPASHCSPLPSAAVLSHTALYASRSPLAVSASHSLLASTTPGALSASVSALSSRSDSDSSGGEDGLSDGSSNDGSVDERGRSRVCAASRRASVSDSSVRRVSLHERSQQLTPILTQRAQHYVGSPSLDDTVTSAASTSAASTASMSAVSVSLSPFSAVPRSPTPSPSPQPLSPPWSDNSSDYAKAHRRPVGLHNLGNTVSPHQTRSNTHARLLTRCLTNNHSPSALSIDRLSPSHCSTHLLCGLSLCAVWLVGWLFAWLAQCYFNAAVQCLLSLPHLLSYFSTAASCPAPTFVRDVNPAGQLARAFASLCSQVSVERSPAFTSPLSAGSVTPSSLLRCFTSLDVSFGDSGQHDAQELLRCLVSRLHDDVNRVRHPPPYEQLDERAGESEWQQSERYWHNYTARNRSIVTDLFAGQLRSEVCCLRCRRRRVAFDPFLDLSLPLPPPSSRSAARDTVTLEQCFDAFTASEQLSADNALYCPHCKRHTATSKALSLYRLPSVLVLHIKRFDFNTGGRAGGRRKIDTPIVAPLTMALTVTSGSQQPHGTLHRYALLATINHLGSAHGGHYLAHARLSQQWYTFNDSHVQAIDAKHMAAQHSQSAYVLFYQREQS